eukprot:6187409-Pleurochrysis_carterae.AAC.7
MYILGGGFWRRFYLGEMRAVQLPLTCAPSSRRSASCSRSPAPFHKPSDASRCFRRTATRTSCTRIACVQRADWHCREGLQACRALDASWAGRLLKQHSPCPALQPFVGSAT